MTSNGHNDKTEVRHLVTNRSARHGETDVGFLGGRR